MIDHADRLAAAFYPPVEEGHRMAPASHTSQPGGQEPAALFSPGLPALEMNGRTPGYQREDAVQFQGCTTLQF